MSESSEAHYNKILGERYHWMLGAFDEKLVHEIEAFKRLGIPAAKNQDIALDLGCGTGLHTKALLSFGYHVRSVDQSAVMLERLLNVPNVTIQRGDLLEAEHKDARVIVCMGDTLTHLKSMEQVKKVLSMWNPCKIMALSFRNLTETPEGLNRFFVVQESSERIQTCFLEDAGEHVRVHDLFHEKDKQGRWNLHKGSYLKLKVDPEQVLGFFEKQNAEVKMKSHHGFVRMVVGKMDS